MELALPPAPTLPKGGELGLSPFHFPLPLGPGYISHLPAASSYFLKEFYSVERGGVGSFAARWVLAALTASVPEVPYLSSAGSGRGAGFPPAFVSAESRCWHGSEQPPAEIILIVCAAGSAPFCLTW